MAANDMNNNGKHIWSVMDRSSCKRHTADQGDPCFIIFGSEKMLSGVCGRRIKRAGFVGKVSPTSMSLKTNGGRRGKS